MKKTFTLVITLLLVFSFALTACGGGAEEPTATSDPVVEQEATVTRAELIAEYNVYAELFNEVEALLVGQGAYETDAELKAVMDGVYEKLGMAAVVLETEITDGETLGMYNEIQTDIKMLEEIKVTYM